MPSGTRENFGEFGFIVHLASFKDKSPLGYDFIAISSNTGDFMTATQQFCQDTRADISGNAK